MKIDEVLAEGAPPIVAILRGISPQDATAIGDALVDEGVRIIEVPFNSPMPAQSISALQQRLGDRAAIGGGTVLDRSAVDSLVEAGGTVMVTPNTDPDVIAYGVSQGLDLMPGFVTPSEAFRAVAAGARRIKLFPATALGPDYLRALREVLPCEAEVWAVGGTGPANLAEWLGAGAAGIGVGGALYKPGSDAADVRRRAAALVSAWRATLVPSEDAG
jgi:2-dehydro-3-deoxyphosphogalactonate aldolase